MDPPSQRGSPDMIPDLSMSDFSDTGAGFSPGTAVSLLYFSTNVLYPYLIHLLPMICEVIILSDKYLTISKRHRWQENEDNFLHRLPTSAVLKMGPLFLCQEKFHNNIV
jgi:hypothetical protein